MSAKRDRKVKQPVDASTQERILSAAAGVFAGNGYKAATTRMICAAAGVNVALVNYYFRSKAELYKAVVGALFEEVAKPMMAIPGTVRDAETWACAVRTWVRRSLAICVATRPPESHIAWLMGQESQVPPEVMAELMRDFAIPMHACFRRLLRMALREDDPVQINLWHSTVSAQYVIYALAKPDWASRFRPPEMDEDAWLESVVEHICAGIFARLSFQRLVR